jgi:DDE superfamily endonuclease
VGASERDEWLRAAWRVMVAEGSTRRRLVFVDECGTHTSLAPLYGWAPKGQRARLKVARNWGTNITLLASIIREGMGPSLAVEGPTTREMFEAYLEQVLAPALKPGHSSC